MGGKGGEMRGEVVKKVRRSALVLAFTLAPLAWGQEVPKDVPPGHWAREAVAYLMAKGYLVGYPDGTFRGDEPVNRYQLAMVLYRVLAMYPQVVLDEEAVARLRPLVKELVKELYQVEGERPVPTGEAGASREALEELSRRVEALTEKVEALHQKGEAPRGGQEVSLDVADLVVQLGLLQSKLELLSSGELPPGLRDRILAATRSVYEARLSSLEGRIGQLEARLARLEARVEGDKREVESKLTGLAEDTRKAQGALEERLKRVEETRLETYLQANALYRAGTDPYAPGATPGLYVSTGLGVYDPAKGEGYESFAGRTPDATLLGLGYLRGTPQEGLYLRGVYALSGALGLSLQGWHGDEAGYWKGTFSFRNYAMPFYLVPEFTGLMVEGRGEAAGASYQLKAWGLITAEGKAFREVVTSYADPCAKTAYGGLLSTSVPFASFRVETKGSYQVENAFSPACSLGSFTGYTYELAVAHDPSSKQAIVPGLGLSLYYGGHSATLDGTPFGLSYWGAKGSYFLEFGLAKVGVAGFWKSFTADPAHASLPPQLLYELYPASGQMYGGSLALRLGEERAYGQVEVDYRMALPGGGQARFLGLTPSVGLEGEGFSLKLAYRYGYGLNWDPKSPNPLFATGVYALSSLEGEGKLGDWRFSVAYDLTARTGTLALAYRMAW